MSFSGEVLFWQSRFEEIRAVAEEGLACLGGEQESVEAALMNVTAALGAFAGERERRREFFLRNAAFLQRLPYSEELRPAYTNVINVYVHMDRNAAEAEKWLRVLEQKAEQHHDLRALGEVHQYAGALLTSTGDLDGALCRCQQALELFTNIGDRKHQSWAWLHMGRASLLLGALQQAEEQISRALEILEDVGMKRDIAQSSLLLGMISLCRGSFPEAIDRFQTARQLINDLGWPTTWPDLWSGRAYLASGKRQEAVKQLQETAARVKTDAASLAAALSGLEEACESPEEFHTFCRRLREEHPDVGDAAFVQWSLEPAEADVGFRILDCRHPNTRSKMDAGSGTTRSTTAASRCGAEWRSALPTEGTSGS